MQRNSGTRMRMRNGHGRVFLAALSITTAVFGDLAVMPGAAFAQVTASRPFSIPAGPLNQALATFGRQAGIQVAYNPSVAIGKRSGGVSGNLDPEAAMARLLQGSGLAYSFTSFNTVAISEPANAADVPASDGATTNLGPIVIEGRRESAWGPTDGYIATQDGTATKTDTPLIEVPQTVNVVTRDQIEAQGAQNVTEATRYTPGVVATFGDSDSRNDVLQTRGFYVRYNLNGSRLPYGAYSAAMLRIEPYGLERIDVLKGPSSVLYGQNLPGGLINLTSKRPTDTPFHEVEVQAGNHESYQGAFDFSGPIDPEGELLYRLTGLARDSNGLVDYGYDRRQFIAPALTWQPTDDTSLTILGHYQKDDTISDYAALPAAGTLYSNPNGKLPRSRYAGEPDFDGYEREQYSVGYNFRHDFENNWTIRQNLQLNHVDVDTKASPGYMLDPTQRYLSRVASQGIAEADSLTVDTNLEGRFDTGPVAHTVLIGADYLYLDDRYRFASNLYGGTFDLYDPVYGATAPDLIPRIDYRMKRHQFGLYAQDQLRWENWILTAGIRNDWVKADSSSFSVDSFSADDTAFTGRIGLTYLFDNGFAPYLSYATSFDPVDGVNTTGGPLKPTEGEQLEAGIKYQSPGGGSFVTLSAFQITEQNRTASSGIPGNPGMVQTGEARVRGFEVEAKTELTDNLNLIASYAYMDSEVTKVNASTAALLGKELVMVPNHQASIWLDYEVEDGALAGLGVGGGLRYQGRSYGDNANAFEVGGQVLVDAALSYDFGKVDERYKGLDLRVTATNLFDKEYVGYCQGSMQCYYGQGRMVKATLKYRW